MIATAALEVGKTLYRYGRIPLDRIRPHEEPMRAFFVRKAPKEVLLQYFPGERVRACNGAPSRLEFYIKWMPWLLSDARARVYHAGNRLPDFIRRFCTRHRIPVEDLNLTRPDIPASFLTTPPAGTSGATQGERAIPTWFQSRPTPQTKAALASGKPVFLYVPWIAEHGDALISRIESDSYELLPFDMMKDVDNNDTRRTILRFARANPDLYRQMVIRRLVPIRATIAGVIVTFDWAPVMRIIVGVCKELGIPTILIPHESVFVDRDKYYWDPTSQASIPVSDVTLGWGGLQKDIFVERGYPAERFTAVGAPKFDTYHDYRPLLTRKQFCTLFGLDPERKIILFASQPLDSQLDTAVARNSQRAAIADLIAYCEDNDAQLIVRLPPSKDDILGLVLRNTLLRSAHGAYDDATCYLVGPEEALYHCDVVTSVNSTMLFEGLLLGRYALSMKYVEFEQFWERAGIPAARSADEARPILDAMLAGTWAHDEEGMRWAAGLFGVGAFDGRAADRIRAYLTDVATGKAAVATAPSAVERLVAGEALDVVAIDCDEEALGTTRYFLPKLLNIRTLRSSLSTSLAEVASVDVFLHWGAGENGAGDNQRSVARLLGRPVAVVEDGFIRSVKIGLSGEPSLSVIVDDTTAHYDATRPSGLERLLQGGRELTNMERRRALGAIRQILGARVSKYNHAPDETVAAGRPGRPKVLVVDQRRGDLSISGSLADEDSFERMLLDAVTGHPDHDILIKAHPDAIGGGAAGYFTKTLPQLPDHERERVFFIDRDVNPYALIEPADAVFTVSSLMGFEALMAGKAVHCYGAPFYSGWGVTVDHRPVPRRTRRRSVEEIFHFAYIEASRYVNPETHQRVEIEELVTFIGRKKAELAAASRTLPLDRRAERAKAAYGV